MRKVEVHDVKTGPLRDPRHKLRPHHGPYLVDAKTAQRGDKVQSVSFKRVRAEVTEFWSGDPIDDATFVQKVAEYGRSPGFPPYPPVQEVHPELGVWDLYLPADLEQELDRQRAHEFEYEEADLCFASASWAEIRNHVRNRRALARRLAERSCRCPADTSTDGDNRLFGGAGFDGMVGYGGDDLLSGGARSDFIDAKENSENPCEDIVRGGRGRDFIDAIDKSKDTINCGKGTKDEVFYDENLDTVENCEIVNIQYPEQF